MLLAKNVLVLALAAIVGSAFAAIAPVPSALDVAVSTQLKAGKPAVDVAREQLAQNTDLGLLAVALVSAGVSPSQVVTAIIAAGGDAAAATAAVIAASSPADVDAIVAAAKIAAPTQIAQIDAAAAAASLQAALKSNPAGAGPLQGDGGSPGGTVGLTAPSFGGGGGSTASPR